MCFSPEASFAGGVIILTIGVVTVTKVHKPTQLVFAFIPIFFGIQQFTEGFLWLALRNEDYRLMFGLSKYVFLVMADVLWPSLIPLSVLLMETNRKRKKALWFFLGAGIGLSAYYTFCLIRFSVTPQIVGYHILYNSEFPEWLSLPALAVYLLVTITPLFISSIRRTHILGILMFFSCAITALFFTRYLTSVWCFFAALISAVIFWILQDSRRKFRLNKLLHLNNGN